MKVLIVEDEKLISDTLKELLESKGFEVDCVYNGEEGTECALLGIYDFLVLDAMMPGMDGYQAARNARGKNCAVSIIMLTENSNPEYRIEGLNAGADYCLAKPLDIREFLSCVNALVRRQGAQPDNMQCGNTTLDFSTAILSCGEKQARLSAKEFDIMRILLQSGTKNLSKEILLARVWGLDTDAVENHVEVYVGFLRKKLDSIGSDITIKAVRRLGYHLEVIQD